MHRSGRSSVLTSPRLIARPSPDSPRHLFRLRWRDVLTDNMSAGNAVYACTTASSMTLAIVHAPASATTPPAIGVRADPSRAATGRRDDVDPFGSRSGHGASEPHPAGVRAVPLQILVADDHQIVRQGIKIILERHGFQVAAEAANGREAVRLAQAHAP